MNTKTCKAADDFLCEWFDCSVYVDEATPSMILHPGNFYISRNGHIWCCFRIDPKAEDHTKAYCVRLTDNRVEYFYLDGRYDKKGEREHTLVERVKP